MKKYITDYSKLDRECYYGRGDLGVTVDGEITRFKVWAPFCSCVYLNLYTGGEGDNKIQTLVMRSIENGVWYVELMHTCYGQYYTYTFEFAQMKRIESIDIYAKACGVNGNRGLVVDFDSLNPPGWDDIHRPRCENPVDAVIYECHIRDFTIDPSCGIPDSEWYRRGRFSGFAAEGTRCGSVTTCLDHLKELGITHVQLMPVYDYATIDEKKPFAGKYNWGYDPKNYMCLEGYYCSDPEEGEVRIREFKEMVAALHRAGIGVIMDVVFNHTYYTEESAFHKAVPYYYHRLTHQNKFSNGSGCGNETASEHFMFRKYMLDAMTFWVKEYKIDGFRFDLMGLHDIDTINMLRREMDKIDPSILMYGEGWTGGEPAYPADKLCYKWNSYSFGRVGLFNDNIRDGIKGSTFELYGTGFVSGNNNARIAIKRGVTANTRYRRLQGVADDLCWAFTPAQAINYCEAHDNNTLWDKLAISAKNYTEDERRRMDKLAAAIVILSQGVPFLHLGQDFLRSKPKVLPEGTPRTDLNRFDENSYNAPDFTNKIHWEDKEKNIDVFRWYRALIMLRKSSPLFRMRTPDELDQHLHFHDNNDIVTFELTGSGTNGFAQECYFVIFNNRRDDRHIDLPHGTFYERLGESCRPIYKAVQGSVCVPGISCVVYKKLM